MMHKLGFVAFGLLAAALHGTALADCDNTKNSQTEDNRTAQIPFGRLNLTSEYLQPVGSLLASVVVPPTAYTYKGANAETILWTCLLRDMSGVHFLVATNGDDRVGGYWDLGAADGIPNTYATWFAYVGLRQTMGNVVLQRKWQAIPVENYDVQGGRAVIRLKHLPTMQAELFRISNIPGPGVSNFCDSKTKGPKGSPKGLGTATAAGTPYVCTQPSAYIQLVGPGLTHDEAGQDSAYKFDFWGVDNGFGYGMRSVNTLASNATCMVRYSTAQVVFPLVSVDFLNSGGSVDQSFNVQVECQNAVSSGTDTGQTAIGIQVSQGAFNAAKKLGLVNATGGVTALVDDQYSTNPQAAQGVGVYLKWAGGSQSLNFVGQPGSVGGSSFNSSGVPISYHPRGAAAGWYPVLGHAQRTGSGKSGYSNYNMDFDVSLKKLPGKEVTAGSFRATAYVLVKVQ